MRKVFLTIILGYFIVLFAVSCIGESISITNENVGVITQEDMIKQFQIPKLVFTKPPPCEDFYLMCRGKDDIIFCYHNHWYLFGLPCVNCKKLDHDTFSCDNSFFIDGGTK